MLHQASAASTTITTASATTWLVKTVLAAWLAYGAGHTSPSSSSPMSRRNRDQYRQGAVPIYVNHKLALTFCEMLSEHPMENDQVTTDH